MASDTVTHAVTNTLSGTTADTITLTGVQEYLEVINHHATVPLYFTLQWDEEATSGPVPTAVTAADEAYCVLPGTAKPIPVRSNQAVLSVVGVGNTYTIQSF